MPGIEEETSKKRKLDNLPEIEIDVSAAEPPSKKALRKAKKKGITPEEAAASIRPQSETTEGIEADEDEDENSNVQNTPAKKNKKKTSTSTTTETEKRSVYGVWVGNLAFTTTKEDLRKFITSGTSIPETRITRIHLPAGSSTQHGRAQNKGFAYVDFSTREAMEEAIGLSERLLTGRRLLIKDAKSYEGRPEPHQKAGSGNTSSLSGMPPSSRIFVGNLAFEATKESLEEHLSPCGPIGNIHMATFEDSGKCKGYAWVEFESVEAATAAVKGFALVTEDVDMEEESNSDSEAQAGKKTQKKKKVWVNRLFGRQLRMEFAEDPASRYKKRFGKERPRRDNTDATGDPALSHPSTDDQFQAQPTRSRPSTKDHKRNIKPRAGYTTESVHRLTGAIVDAKGVKTTFE